MAEGKIPNYVNSLGDWYGRNNWLTERERGTLNITYDKNTITIDIFTAYRHHAENDLIFTIPDPFRPHHDIWFVCYNGVGFANLIRIFSNNGEGQLWVDQKFSGDAPLIGSVTYIYHAH